MPRPTPPGANPGTAVAGLQRGRQHAAIAATAASATSARALKVGGVTPFTRIDFPGTPAAVVFVQGCPWKCGYCHNPHLQPRMQKSPLDWARVLKLLEQRRRGIDAVVFSGGEPTLDPGLLSAVRDVRGLGLRAGLHTAGTYPESLQQVLPLLDWVALDIKAPFDRYETVTDVEGSGAAVRACAQALLASGVSHEFRTTVHPALLSEADIAELARELAALGSQQLTLQGFRAQGCRDTAFKAYKAEDASGYPSTELLHQLAATFPRFAFHPG